MEVQFQAFSGQLQYLMDAAAQTEMSQPVPGLCYCTYAVTVDFTSLIGCKNSIPVFWLAVTKSICKQIEIFPGWEYGSGNLCELLWYWLGLSNLYCKSGTEADCPERLWTPHP